MKILVTAGPTREPLDPVRYIGNRSSGRTGFAVARALVSLGHEVVLVHGPVSLPPPEGVRLIAIETGLEMLAACKSIWEECDGMISVAAVADFRPASQNAEKIKRTTNQSCTLALIANPDIVASLARTKGERSVVGFSLETRNDLEEAKRKLLAKDLDFVVLNEASAQGALDATWTLLGKNGIEACWGPLPKEILARQLVNVAFPGLI